MRSALVVVVVVMGCAQFISADDAKPTKAELLAKFDADGDGKLSGDERRAVIQARAKAKNEAREQRQRDRTGELSDDQLLQMFDANRNGKLDRLEKTRANAFQRQRRQAMQQAFRPPVQQIIGPPQFPQFPRAWNPFPQSWITWVPDMPRFPDPGRPMPPDGPVKVLSFPTQ